jgi:hypothetical protein
MNLNVAVRNFFKINLTVNLQSFSAHTTYPTRNNCTVADAIKLRRLDDAIERVVLVSPVVELQMAL